MLFSTSMTEASGTWVGVKIEEWSSSTDARVSDGVSA